MELCLDFLNSKKQIKRSPNTKKESNVIHQKNELYIKIIYDFLLNCKNKFV